MTTMKLIQRYFSCDRREIHIHIVRLRPCLLIALLDRLFIIKIGTWVRRTISFVARAGWYNSQPDIFPISGNTVGKISHTEINDKFHIKTSRNPKTAFAPFKSPSESLSPPPLVYNWLLDNLYFLRLLMILHKTCTLHYFNRISIQILWKKGCMGDVKNSGLVVGNLCSGMRAR